MDSPHICRPRARRAKTLQSRSEPALPQMEILTMGDPAQLKRALKPPFHRFDGYEFDDVRTIVIDLMAGSVTYKVRAVRGKNEYRATGCTTWSQASDGEWRVVCHQETVL